MGIEKRHKTDVVKEYSIKPNIFYYDVGYGKTSKDTMSFMHPAIFPEELANDHVVSWSNKNDIILDPFMGSGTTAKMAILNDRKWIGFEISEEYVGLANNRIDGIYPQLSIFDFYNEGEKNE